MLLLKYELNELAITSGSLIIILLCHTLALHVLVSCSVTHWLCMVSSPTLSHTGSARSRLLLCHTLTWSRLLLCHRLALHGLVSYSVTHWLCKVSSPALSHTGPACSRLLLCHTLTWSRLLLCHTLAASRRAAVQCTAVAPICSVSDILARLPSAALCHNLS